MDSRQVYDQSMELPPHHRRAQLVTRFGVRTDSIANATKQNVLILDAVRRHINPVQAIWHDSPPWIPSLNARTQRVPVLSRWARGSSRGIACLDPLAET